MQLGSPDNPQPVDILYTKIIASLAIPAAIMLLFQSIWPVLLVPLCFNVPDVLLKSKIQQRQAEILGNFSTTVDLAALIIESGLDYLTAFERIIKIAKEKTILEEELEKTINEIKPNKYLLISLKLISIKNTGNSNIGGHRDKGGRSKSGYYKGLYCGSTYELVYTIYKKNTQPFFA